MYTYVEIISSNVASRLIVRKVHVKKKRVTPNYTLHACLSFSALLLELHVSSKPVPERISFAMANITLFL
jgi:hypothetical protein